MGQVLCQGGSHAKANVKAPINTHAVRGFTSFKVTNRGSICLLKSDYILNT